MSLHRVGSMSSYEHVRGSSPARTEHRKMSFNPVGTWAPPQAQEEPVAAVEMSKTKRKGKEPISLDCCTRLIPSPNSTSNNCRYLLPLCRRYCLRICSIEASARERGCLSRSMYTGGARPRRRYLLRARNKVLKTTFEVQTVC